MRSLFKLIVVFFCINFVPFFTSSCTHARPPKPGGQFVWVAPHPEQRTVTVPGHWKYCGTIQPNRIWVQGHYSPNGVWRPGHWKKKPGNRPGKVWVSGHYNPQGIWIVGFWK